MESSNIRNIIRTFFEKDSSKNTQFLFRKWFRLDELHAEKESSMNELWENSPSAISAQTLEDFQKVKTLIAVQAPLKPVYSFYRRFISYAAVIAIVIASSVYLTYRFAVPEQLEYTQLSVSNSEIKKVTLSDGSIVSINAGSTLIYPKSFTGDTRSVYLTGEANFSVAKNPKKPFIVKTKYLDVRAIGTKFVVQSYPNVDYTKATLVEGSVRVDMETDKNKSFILKPNNQLIYSHQNKKITISEVDATKMALWEEGYLIFQGVTFDEIASTLERKYNVVVNYNVRKLNMQSYYLKFKPDESIEEVMNVISKLIHKSSYKIEGSTVYFYTND